MNVSSKRPSTQKRHENVIRRFDELMEPNEHGLHPEIVSVYYRIEEEMGYSKRYIERILKAPKEAS